jgi:hypothetical protein
MVVNHSQRLLSSYRDRRIARITMSEQPSPADVCCTRGDIPRYRSITARIVGGAWGGETHHTQSATAGPAITHQGVG